MCALMLVCRHVHLCVPEHCRKIKLPPPPVCACTPLILNFKGRGRSRGKEWNRLEDLLCFGCYRYPAPLDLHSERRGCRQGAMGLGLGEGERGGLRAQSYTGAIFESEI